MAPDPLPVAPGARPPAALPKFAAPLSPVVPRNPDPPDGALSAPWEKLPPIVSLMDRLRPNIEVFRGTLTLIPPVDMPLPLEPIDPKDPCDPMPENIPEVPSEALPAGCIELPPDGAIEKLPPPESSGEENPPPFPAAKDNLGSTNWNLTPPGAVAVSDRGTPKGFDPADCGRK